MKKNYLVYVRAHKGDNAPGGLSIPDRIEMLEEYARFNGWNVVGHCVDADEHVKCADEAKLPNLRRYLAKHSDIDVVVATTVQRLSFADYAAMNTILNRGTRIIPITIREEEDSESEALPSSS